MVAVRAKPSIIPRRTGEWGLGTGDWGLGTGDWGLGTGDSGFGIRGPGSGVRDPGFGIRGSRFEVRGSEGRSQNQRQCPHVESRQKGSVILIPARNASAWTGPTGNNTF